MADNIEQQEQQKFHQDKETPTKAVGMTAISSSMKHVFGAMSVGRGVKSLLNLNQVGGIDCPSCAWPDPDKHRSPVAEYCENGAKAIAEEATDRRVGLPMFQRYSLTELNEKSDFWLGKQGRLTQPMVKNEGCDYYEPITWQGAFELIAKELNQLNSPNEAVFYTSGRSSNEAAYLYQLFARAYGTNNMPDCSNMCHESSGVSLINTLGIGKGSVTLDDFYESELIIIMGQNPGTNHPRMLTALEKAKANGAKVVAVNPLKETGLLGFRNPQTVKGMLRGGVDLADLYLQIRINGDMALLQVLQQLLFQKSEANSEVIDEDFIEQYTNGFDVYKAHLLSQNTTQLMADTGLHLAEIMELAELLANRKRIIICWAMGLTQHKNSVPTLNEVVNLLLLKGSIGIPGGGTCPVRGHSNVQGDRTVGITHKPPKALNEALEKKYGFTPPTATGYDVVEGIVAMHAGKAKVFMALGGNLLSAAPDTDFTAAAFRNCELTVQISTKLNRSHLITGKKALILPCLGRTDIDQQKAGKQFLSTENSMGVVQRSQGVLEPLSNTMMSEPAIVANIAKATLKNTTIDWDSYIENYEHIRRDIAEVIPGFNDYQTRVEMDGGFYLPNGARNRQFNTESGKAEFTVNQWQAVEVKDDEYLMMTIRSHDQYNTTIYGLDDRYRGIFNARRIVFMNEDDIRKEGFSDYQKVTLVNEFGGKERIAKDFMVVPYQIPRGCLATYFPEANVLVPMGSRADGSQTPTSKSVVVKIKA